MLQQQETLATTFSEVLANLAFMFVSEEGEDAPPVERWMETRVGYRGPLAGELRLRCTPDFSRILTANLLGLDPDDGEVAHKSEDALKELMNVLCGQFVTAVYGPDGVFNVSIPTVAVDVPPLDPASAKDDAWTCVFVDGQPVQIAHEPTIL
jgi:hypothetical protein